MIWLLWLLLIAVIVAPVIGLRRRRGRKSHIEEKISERLPVLASTTRQQFQRHHGGDETTGVFYNLHEGGGRVQR